MVLKNNVHLFCIVACVSLCVPSYLRRFHMDGAEILQVCPGVHGDVLYIHFFSKFSVLEIFDTDYVQLLATQACFLRLF